MNIVYHNLSSHFPISKNVLLKAAWVNSSLKFTEWGIGDEATILWIINTTMITRSTCLRTQKWYIDARKSTLDHFFYQMEFTSGSIEYKVWNAN